MMKPDTPLVPIILAAMILSVLARPAAAIGEAGAAFLKLPVGARECAMGGAGTALAGGPTALRWNPAGLARAGDRRADLLHGAWLEGMSFQHAGVSAPLARGHAGISMIYSSSGDIPGYDVNAQPTGDYGASDMAVTLGYARPFGSRLRIGAAGTLIRQTIEEEDAVGLAADVGLLLDAPLPADVEVALAVRNLGPAITFIDKSDPLPLTVSAAAAWRWRALTASVETSRARGADALHRAGIEAVLFGTLALRTGYLARAEMDDAVTFGLGIMRGAIVIDYAYVPVHEIANTHHVGVSLWF